MAEISLAHRVLDVAALPDFDNREGVDAALARAHDTLTCGFEQLSGYRVAQDALANRSYVREFGLWHSPDISERYVGGFALREIFLDRKMTFATNLNSWPLFQKLHEENVRNDPEALKVTNALLLGSLSALSSVAFMAQAQDIYGAEHAAIIDLVSGEDKKRHGKHHGNLVLGDVLNLPVQKSSLQLVQGNQIIASLVAGPSKKSAANDEEERILAERLLGQVYDALEPGGHLLLRECASRLGREDKEGGYQNKHSKARIAHLQQSLPNALAAAGFRTVHIEEVHDIVGVDYLFDKTRNFERYPTEKNPTSIAAYARK